MCWECWDDQMTEENEDMLGDVMWMSEGEVYEWMRCGREITREEYKAYNGMCEECYLIEIDELDYEDEEYWGKYCFLQWRVYYYKPLTAFF